MDINNMGKCLKSLTGSAFCETPPSDLVAACAVYHVLNSFLDGEFEDQHDELEQKGSSVLHYVAALIVITVGKSHSHEWEDAEWQIKLIDEARDALRDQSC